ncbi:LysE family translocator [Glutamicibacter arilaitensis]|jgi:threonine/homoserine/homoserine lactone efflux protein|uniref:LysE family translocator n=2 Tax=Glutamicibacter arilaitensis TaxID=256701 RepID=A0A2N7S3Q6_9MICC|nr:MULTISPECIES: LysE family translocator [Glutamicibacter]PMQ20737.1 LysE family translocator [Glutamicibacter arilaitensis]TFH56977.1 LysE family translocator [Glutamicibacter arilaitensis]CBT76090.1 RHBT family amino acid transporter [Glutamicibacter arilaitensis Re117]HCH47579.1 LysE family translocator [Glutamicibacter sp.]HCJ55054.1 LysE family translocator [Glutamicibacter sp.]
MDLAQFTGFLLVSVTLACTPGADWAYIISSALGKTSYRPAVWGLLSGYLVHTALLVCGIATLVASSPTLLMWLTAAGSIYLLWLGISTLRSAKRAKFFAPDTSTRFDPATGNLDSPPHPRDETGSPIAVLEKVRHQSPSKQFFKGSLTSGTNPKALLLYVALIPQYLDSSQKLPLSLQTGALGLTHFAVSVLVYFSVAMAAKALLRSRPLAARIVTLCSGIIMILLSLGLIYEQFFVA